MHVQAMPIQHSVLFGKGFKIRKPRRWECESDEEFDDVMGDYEDSEHEKYLERKYEEADRIHEQRRDEKMEKEMEDAKQK